MSNNQVSPHESPHARQKLRRRCVKFKKKQNDALKIMNRGESIFITGAGGVGKTSVLKAFIDCAKTRVAITSTTVDSANILKGSLIKDFLGFDHWKDSVSTMTKKIRSYYILRQRWVSIECLIIDEISMIHPTLFDKLEQVSRIIRGNSKPFGGIQLIIAGDFLQLPCEDTMDFCFQAKSWNSCIKNVIYLDQIIRQGEKMFQDCLNNVRIGNLIQDTRNILNSRVGVILKNKHDIRPTKLYARNVNVNRENNNELDKLAEDGRDFYAYEMTFKTNTKYMINKFIQYCQVEQRIELCVGAQVMLTKNIDQHVGLNNGSRGIVINFVSDMPVIRFLNGIERIIFMDTLTINEKGGRVLEVFQIPVMVAYAMSIHKSQGRSLDYAEIDLSDMYDYGQAYVALSRVKTLEGLSIIAINYDYIKADPVAVKYYKNIIEKNLKILKNKQNVN